MLARRGIATPVERHYTITSSLRAVESPLRHSNESSVILGNDHVAAGVVRVRSALTWRHVSAVEQVEQNAHRFSNVQGRVHVGIAARKLYGTLRKRPG